MMWSNAYYLEITLRLFLAELYSVVFRVSCIVRQQLNTNIQISFFYKTIAPTVLKCYMKHDLGPGSQNYKIESGGISKMAAITKNSKNNNINFFSRSVGYFG